MTMNENATRFLDELYKKRSKVVDAHQENNFELYRLLSDMYTGEAHFVYELLQNAEDARATSVRFILSRDGLLAIHDGERRFTEQDVDSITNIGNSTKRDDLNAIGKFGVGFKAVFAYTATPRIHSGPFSFEIQDMFCPRPVEKRDRQDERTFLQLPFNRPDKPPKECLREVTKSLHALRPRTLLFLKHIKKLFVKTLEIKFKLTRSDCYQDPVKNCAVRRVHLGGNRSEEQWLLFERKIVIKSEDQKEVASQVEIAFRLKKDSSGERIIREANSPLVVFFPTDKPTNLGFLVQGPYRTTPSRDNIPHENPSNKAILRETAELVVDSLRWLKDKGMLSVAVLETMPIDRDIFPEDGFFRPIFDRVLRAIREEELLPAPSEASSTSAFVSGKNAKAAQTSELRTLLSTEQLRTLFDEPTSKLRWLSAEINSVKARRLWDYLLDEVGIEVVDSKRFVSALSHDFLAEQTDEWIGNFYAFLLNQKSWLDNVQSDFANVPFRNKPIIRLESNRHVAPFNNNGEPAAWLPGSGFNIGECVKPEVLKKQEARDFLLALGFKEPDECDYVLKILLPRYRQERIPTGSEYVDDLRRISIALRKSGGRRQELKNGFADLAFVLAENSQKSSRREHKLPTDVYIASPDLRRYFDGNADAWFLASELVKEFEDLMVDLGVAKEVRVKKRKNNNPGAIQGVLRRGVGDFDWQCDVDGLKFALLNPTEERSKYVWNKLLIPNTKQIRGLIEQTVKGDFSDAKKCSDFSKMGKLAHESEWLPLGENFVRPSNLALEDLPNDFIKSGNFAEQLAEHLGMRKTSEQATTSSSRADLEQLAKKVGVELDDVEYLKHHKEEFKEFKRWRAEQGAKPALPVAEPKKSDVARTKGQAAVASKVRRPVHYQRVRVDWKIKKKAKAALRRLNTNEDGQMVCQICGNEMPFKLKNGKYHFDAVECVKGLPPQLPWNYIALCPLCSAMYRHANYTSAKELERRILDAQGCEVPVRLVDEMRHIYFTKTHLIDLKIALRSIQSP